MAVQAERTGRFRRFMDRLKDPADRRNEQIVLGKSGLDKTLKSWGRVDVSSGTSYCPAMESIGIAIGVLGNVFLPRPTVYKNVSSPGGLSETISSPDGLQEVAISCTLDASRAPVLQVKASEFEKTIAEAPDREPSFSASVELAGYDASGYPKNFKFRVPTAGLEDNITRGEKEPVVRPVNYVELRDSAVRLGSILRDLA